jgi:hypothetical protein
VDPLKHYISSVCRQRIALICSKMGWQATQESCMQVLVDLLARYTHNLGVEMQRRAECCNRTTANMVDVERTLSDMGVDWTELEDYVENFDGGGGAGKDAATRPTPIPNFPAEAETKLNFLKPGSREVLHRKIYVNEYFPPMYPELEEDVASTAAQDGTDNAEVKREANAEASDHGLESLSTLAEGDSAEKKRPSLGDIGDHAATGGESHSQLRDIPSVMMTSAGFISPVREGKMAESRTPHGAAAQAAAAAAIREEREEEMKMLTAARMKKQAEATPMPAPSNTSPGNKKKLAIFQKKSSSSTSSGSKASKYHESLATAATSSSKAKSSLQAAHVHDSISSVIERGVKETQKAAVTPKQLRPVEKTVKIPKVTKASPAKKIPSALSAQKKKAVKGTVKGRGVAKAEIKPLSAEFVPDSPPSPSRSPSPQRSSPIPPPTPPPPAPKIKELTLPPPPPVAPSPPPEAVSAAAENPLIPKGGMAPSFYGFGGGGSESDTKAGRKETKSSKEEKKSKEKKKKNKKDKSKDKKKKKERRSSSDEVPSASTSASSTAAGAPITTPTTPSVPKIKFKGIGDGKSEKLKSTPTTSSPSLVIKARVSSSVKAERKRKRESSLAPEGVDMMFKEPLKIDRPAGKNSSESVYMRLVRFLKAGSH